MMPGDKRGLNNESVLRIKSAFEVAVLFMLILVINCVMEVVLNYHKTSLWGRGGIGRHKGLVRCLVT